MRENVLRCGIRLTLKRDLAMLYFIVFLIILLSRAFLLFYNSIVVHVSTCVSAFVHSYFLSAMKRQFIATAERDLLAKRFKPLTQNATQTAVKTLQF